MKIKVGDIIKRPYPFILNESVIQSPYGLSMDPFWTRGVNRRREGESQYFPGELFIECDAEGEAEIEILAITEMPRKIKTRVLFMLKFTDPDGQKTNSGVKMESLDNLTKRLKGSFYGCDYDVFEDD